MCSSEPLQRLKENVKLKTQVRSRACLAPHKGSVKAKVYELVTLSFPRCLIIHPGRYRQGEKFLNMSKEQTPGLSFLCLVSVLAASSLFPSLWKQGGPVGPHLCAASAQAVALLYFSPERPWMGSQGLSGFALTLPHSPLPHSIAAPGLSGFFHQICSAS